MQRGRAAGPLAKKAWYYHAHLAIITNRLFALHLGKSEPLMTQSTASLLGNALAHYEFVMEEPFGFPVNAFDVSDDAFWATASIDADNLKIEASTAVAEQITQLWDRLGGFEGIAADVMVRNSLVWLLLHETQHAELGHFTLMGTARISEGHPPSFGVVSRPKMPQAFADLPTVTLVALPYCLEMQSDHNAIALMIEQYSTGKWDVLRKRVAAMVAMIVLIERADLEHGERTRSHPKTATRLFQLLGYVHQLPLTPAMAQAREHGRGSLNPADIPDQSELDAYFEQVTKPCFQASCHIIVQSGVSSLLDGLGSDEAFFHDLDIIAQNQQSRFTELQTPGAQELVRLIEHNNLIMAALNQPIPWVPKP
mmetsp:Transcript_28490/g.53416  ORF Transcript_28490/g.53416 Transcript_28490/m.53416 type:complete len:367 (+) Transcript_28490:476-1576(+)